MKKIILFLAAISSALAGQAQITIDSSDIGSIGDQMVYVRDTAVVGQTAASPTGAFQTFDYTNLNPTQVGYVNFISPIGTPGAVDFPNANLVITLPSGDFIYSNKTSSSVIVDGFYGDILDLGVAFAVDLQPNINLMSFPLNYMDTYTETTIIDTVVEDTYSGTGIFDSLRLKRTMSIVTNFDAYGELNLPTISDTVLRRYDIEVTVDSVWGQIANTWQSLQQANVTEYYYRFIAKNSGYYLLEAQADAAGIIITADFQTGNAIIANITQSDDASCYGKNDGYVSSGAIGGTPPYSYLWSNGQTTNAATSLVAGAYSVLVTDAVGDTSSASTVVGEPDSITIVSTQIGADHGINDGYIFINVTGGKPAYAYVWSNSETTKNIENLTFGNYSVVVTDNNQCINTATFTVDNMTSVKDLSTANGIALYPNPSNGFVTLDLEKGWQFELFNTAGTQVYSRQGSGKETMDLSGIKFGLYVVKIYSNEQQYVGKLQLTY